MAGCSKPKFKKLVREFHRQRSRKIIPNAINKEFITAEYSGPRNKQIVSSGRLTEQKNHALLIKAFAGITAKYPAYKLVIYGDGPLRKDLELLASNLGIADKVSFPGYTTEIRKKIERSSLFVLSSDFEGMPNALMEAMALGVPCISTDCKGGGARFLIKNGTNGLLTPIGDVEALQTAMEKILSDQFSQTILAIMRINSAKHTLPKKYTQNGKTS